jgi:hypothetical protein
MGIYNCQHCGATVFNSVTMTSGEHLSECPMRNPPPRATKPSLVVTGPPNATVSNAEPQYHAGLMSPKAEHSNVLPFPRPAGASVHVRVAPDGTSITIGFANEGDDKMLGCEMAIDKAEMVKASLGAAILEAKRRRGT